MLHQTSRASSPWFTQHVLAVISRRPRHSERLARCVDARYCAIQADLFADIGGGSEASVATESNAPTSDSGSSDDDGGDPDPAPSQSLSAAEFNRQSAAFRTSKTGVPGVRFDIPSGAFRASYVAADGKTAKLGSFGSIDEAVAAISAAYATAGAQ